MRRNLKTEAEKARQPHGRAQRSAAAETDSRQRPGGGAAFLERTPSPSGRRAR
jgi:hypothetical protein